MLPMFIQYITAPLLGGVIGYITNDIAIRMLFRPHTAKYILGIKIPFTPGIIPKEKGRIAGAIGDAISQNLMSKDVLERYLLSREMTLKVRTSLEEFFNRQKKNEESVAQFLLHYISEQELQSIVENVTLSITKQVHGKLSTSQVGVNVAHIVVDNVVNKMKSMDLTELIGGIASGLGGLHTAAASILGGNLIGKFLSLLRDPAEKLLANNINNMLQNNGAEIISNMIGDEVQIFMNTPMAKLFEGKDEQIKQIVNYAESLYETVITEHLPRILDSIDISKIVRERINEMDMDETEKLILQVMNKELKAIVWLGAFLGMIMGCVNIFVF